MEEAKHVVEAWDGLKVSLKKFIKAQREFARIQGIDLETQDIDTSKVMPSKKREEPEPKQEEDFECAGQVWLDPPQECIGGDLTHQKESINFQGPDDKKRRRYTVCKGCKNARNRWNNKRRREEKKQQPNE